MTPTLGARPDQSTAHGSPWSVWRSHDGTDWLPDQYMHLELPWVRTAVGFDSQDWTLDVIASTDAEGVWSVRFNDEDELAFYAALSSDRPLAVS